MVIANSMVAGSVYIGKNCWIAPNAAIKNGVSIQDDALIGLGAVVIKPVEEGAVIIGNPGKELRKK